MLLPVRSLVERGRGRLPDGPFRDNIWLECLSHTSGRSRVKKITPLKTQQNSFQTWVPWVSCDRLPSARVESRCLSLVRCSYHLAGADQRSLLCRSHQPDWQLSEQPMIQTCVRECLREGSISDCGCDSVVFGTLKKNQRDWSVPQGARVRSTLFRSSCWLLVSFKRANPGPSFMSKDRLRSTRIAGARVIVSTVCAAWSALKSKVSGCL